MPPKPLRCPRLRHLLLSFLIPSLFGCANEDVDSPDASMVPEIMEPAGTEPFPLLAFPTLNPDQTFQAEVSHGDATFAATIRQYGEAYVTSGDILIPRSHFKIKSNDDEPQIVSLAKSIEPTWDGGVIPYLIDDSLTPTARDSFLGAIEHWEENTRLRFVEHSDEFDYVVIKDGPGCSSFVGNVRMGPQDLYLSQACGDAATIHELGHAAGFWHEQSREDRDEHVEVHFNNIQPEHSDQFEKLRELSQPGTPIGPYDVQSIMHYGSFGFALDNSQPTITLLDGGTIESPTVLSAGDRAATELIYEPKPSAVNGLRAIQTRAGEIEVAWRDGFHADEFEIVRVRVPDVPGGGIAFTKYFRDARFFYDHNFRPNQHYRYYVYSVNDFGKSERASIDINTAAQ